MIIMVFSDQLCYAALVPPYSLADLMTELETLKGGKFFVVAFKEGGDSFFHIKNGKHYYN